MRPPQPLTRPCLSRSLSHRRGPAYWRSPPSCPPRSPTTWRHWPTPTAQRAHLCSPAAYASLSDALQVGGGADDPACPWLYDTLLSADLDLRLAALLFPAPTGCALPPLPPTRGSLLVLRLRGHPPIAAARRTGGPARGREKRWRETRYDACREEETKIFFNRSVEGRHELAGREWAGKQRLNRTVGLAEWAR